MAAGPDDSMAMRQYGDSKTMKLSSEAEWNEIEEGEDYFDSIDGVRPRDHPETYHDLLHCVCLHIADPEVRVFYLEQRIPRQQICVECYERQGPMDLFVVCTDTHFLYSTLFFLPWAMHCMTCAKLLFKIDGPAYNCRACILEFMENKHLLQAEGVVFVNERW